MADFYSLLRQSLLDRGISDPGDRREIYAQAREAVVKQLWDFKPPLAEDEIDTRVGAYDSAVERIETDLRDIFAQTRVKARKRRARSPLPVPPPPPLREEVDAPALAALDLDGGPRYAREPSPYAPPNYPPPAPRQPEQRYSERPGRALLPLPERQPSRREADEDRYDERWQEPRPGARVSNEPPIWLAWLGSGETRLIRILAITVSCLFVVLVGVISYFLGAQSHGTVTIPVGVRHEVSDAATATRLAAENLSVVQSYSVFDGKDPTVFDTTPDNPVRFDSAGGFARVASAASAAGVRVLIGPGLGTRLAGQTIRLTLEARSSTDRGAATMRFAYQSGVAISHWQTANLEANFAAVALTWRPPALRTSSNDYIIIEPGVPGDGSGADIRSIKIDILPS